MPDYIYVIAILVVFVIGLIAQASVRSTYNRYNNIFSSSGIPAREAAQRMLNSFNAKTSLSAVGGTLTDHYNSRNDTVGLSNAVINSASVSALAVAAHEIGHVQQYYEKYGAIRLRNTILPVASFASQLAPWIAIGGLFLGLLNLIWIGAILYGIVFIFQLVTLPVEFNASKRGIDMLMAGGFISNEQESGARKVLTAAAMTYVIATLASLLTFLRFFALASSSSRRR